MYTIQNQLFAFTGSMWIELCEKILKYFQIKACHQWNVIINYKQVAL